MRVFITGMAGFLGSNLARYHNLEGHEVFGCDTFVGGDINNLHPARNLQQNCYMRDCESLTEMKGLIAHVKPDIVYHCAAYPHEGLSVCSPHTIANSVISSTMAVLSGAINAKVKRFVFLSSMARYGRIQMPPFKEECEAEPVDPYGCAKLAAENMVRILCETHGINYAIAVPHNIYGPNQCYDDPYRNVAAIMFNRVLQGKPPIIYGDGTQTRCFSYIDDVVSPLFQMGMGLADGHVVNLGPDQGHVTIKDLANMVLEISRTKETLEPIYMPERPCEVKHANCSADKARELLDYNPKISVYEGMNRLYKWIKETGPKPFKYDRYPIEIMNEHTPKVWAEKLQ